MRRPGMWISPSGFPRGGQSDGFAYRVIGHRAVLRGAVRAAPIETVVG